MSVPGTRLFEWLTTPPIHPGPRLVTRRGWLLRGGLAGLGAGVIMRVWMRTISDHHVFSIGGTVFILLFFAGLGFLAALAAWWRFRADCPRRPAIVRAVAGIPFAAFGPFMLLFLPGALAAAVTGHPAWGRWRKRLLIGVAVATFGLIELFLLTADVPGNAGVRIASGILYLPLAYAVFLTNRLAFDPMERAPLAAAGMTQTAPSA